MHIAIDLDNTLANTTKACIQVFNEIAEMTLTRDDSGHYRYYEFYGWNEEIYEIIYRRHGHDIHWSTDPYPGAVDAVRQLHDSNQLTILTARPSVFRDVTVAWLNDRQVPYNDVIFEDDKYQFCQMMDIDLLIDDAPHYAREFTRNGRPFMIMDQPYNRNIDHDLIHRLKHWPDVHTMLMPFIG